MLFHVYTPFVNGKERRDSTFASGSAAQVHDVKTIPTLSKTCLITFIEGLYVKLRVCLQEILRVCLSEACENVPGDGL